MYKQKVVAVYSWPHVTLEELDGKTLVAPIGKERKPFWVPDGVVDPPDSKAVGEALGRLFPSLDAVNNGGATLSEVLGTEIGVESRVDGVEELDDAVVIYTY